MFDERFARQYRYEPPPEFPLASPYTGIVHHLSGPNRYAHTQTCHRGSRSATAACPDEHSLWSLSFRTWIYYPHTRIYVRLLGPCFKTGQISPLFATLEFQFSASPGWETLRIQIEPNCHSVKWTFEEKFEWTILLRDNDRVSRRSWPRNTQAALPPKSRSVLPSPQREHHPRENSDPITRHIQPRHSLLP